MISTWEKKLKLIGSLAYENELKSANFLSRKKLKWVFNIKRKYFLLIFLNALMRTQNSDKKKKSLYAILSHNWNFCYFSYFSMIMLVIIDSLHFTI